MGGLASITDSSSASTLSIDPDLQTDLTWIKTMDEYSTVIEGVGEAVSTGFWPHLLTIGGLLLALFAIRSVDERQAPARVYHRLATRHCARALRRGAAIPVPRRPKTQTIGREQESDDVDPAKRSASQRKHP